MCALRALQGLASRRAGGRPENEAGSPQRGWENAKGRRGLGLCSLVSQAPETLRGKVS